MYRERSRAKIRKYLIDNNYIECIIQLPENLASLNKYCNLYYGVKKERLIIRHSFINAPKEFVKATNSNKLSVRAINNNIDNILTAYKNREQLSIFSKLANIKKILKMRHNLSVSTWRGKRGYEEK